MNEIGALLTIPQFGERIGVTPACVRPLGLPEADRLGQTWRLRPDPARRSHQLCAFFFC